MANDIEKEDNLNEVIEIKGMNIFDKQLISHGFSTRLGGVSQGIYESANFSVSMGDKPEAVSENFRRFAHQLGTSTKHMVLSDQVHDTKILLVTKEHRGMGLTTERNFSQIDGLVTKEVDTCLITSHADCLPLFFHDPVSETIGLAHAGWQGVYNDMATKMVLFMMEHCQSLPEDILCAIGPSIQKDSFEVQADVSQLFLSRYEDGKNFLSNQNDKYYFDLQGFTRWQLCLLGLNNDHIEQSIDDTFLLTDTYFSHRRMGLQRGSMVAGMMLNNRD